jgi:hypothetical protein
MTAPRITLDIHLNKKPLSRNLLYKSEVVEALCIKWSADEYDISNVERQMRSLKRLIRDLEAYWIPNHPNLCDIEIVTNSGWLPYEIKRETDVLKKYDFELWCKNPLPRHSVVWIR